MAAQIYDENTSENYPLEDWDETGVPTDILVDMSIAVPGETLPVATSANSNLLLTNLVITDRYAFLSIETAAGAPLCHLMVLEPAPFRIYQLETETGVTGWVVFGPGVARPASYTSIAALISFKCVCANATPMSVDAATIEINGVSYPAPPVLTIRTNELMDSGSLGGSLVFTLARNNAEFTQDMLQNMLRVANPGKGALLYDINGVRPDAAGNVVLEGFTDLQGLTDDTVVLGALVGDITPQNCRDWYAEFRAKQKLGSETPGGHTLPLDDVFKRNG